MYVNYLIEFFVFLLGLCIGSFLNCVIYRLELQEDMPKGSPKRKDVSFMRGKSFCPHCKHKLSWLDLFPIFSYLFLGGKCRYCRAKISAQYPTVELATGVIFLLIYNFKFEILQFLNLLNLTFLFYIAATLIVIFVYDLKHYIIPDKVLLSAIVVTFIYRLFENFTAVGNYLLAALIASGFFFIIWFVSGGKWMGFGDVKLAIIMGFLLGFPNVLTALFLAFFFGAIIGLTLIIFEKKNIKSEIPFGPFLIAGTFLALFCGSQIIEWYLEMFIF